MGTTKTASAGATSSISHSFSSIASTQVLTSTRSVRFAPVDPEMLFGLHTLATGNAVTRRMVASGMTPKTFVRSRALRYRG
jgi:hypothetical protein